jgi:hypothetical protein
MYHKAMNHTNASIGAIVIALEGSRSGAVLQNVLSKMMNTEILTAKTPDSIKGFIPKKIELSDLEVAISYSHHLARLLSASMTNEWTIILEEDAIIQFDARTLVSLIEKVENTLCLQKKPAGIHLFPEQFGIVTGKKNESLLQVIYLPDFAVGYILNRAAVETSINSFDTSKIEIADWPRYMRSQITWFCPDKSLVRHPDLSDLNTRSSTRLIRIERSGRFNVRKLASYKLLPYLLIRAGNFFRLQYGSSPIESNKIRSIRLNFKFPLHYGGKF